MSLGFTCEKKEAQKVSSIATIEKSVHTRVTDLSGIIIVTETSKNKKRDHVNHALWLKSSVTVSVTLAIFLFVFNFIAYTPRGDFIFPSLLGIASLISFMTWLRTMLSMNMLSRKKRSLTRISAWFLYMIAGLCFLSSSLAVMQKNWVMQFLSSIVGSIISWLAFIVIFEGYYRLPTRQQLGALLQILILSLLWELRTFVVNLHFVYEI